MLETFPISGTVETFELVACLERKEAVSTGRTCPNDIGPPAPLAAGPYELRVFEARTATLLLGPVEVRPNGMECPGFATVRKDMGEVYVEPSEEEIFEHVRGLVAS